MEQRSLDAYYDPNFQCEELQSALDKGIQMVDKIKMWYARKHALFSKNPAKVNTLILFDKINVYPF